MQFQNLEVQSSALEYEKFMSMRIKIFRANSLSGSPDREFPINTEAILKLQKKNK